MTGWPEAGAHPASHPDGACDHVPCLPVILHPPGPRLLLPVWAARRDPQT